MSPEPHWAGREPSSGGGSSTLSGLTDVTGPPDPGTGPVYDATGDAPLVPVVTHDDLDAVLAQVAAVEWHTIGDPGEPPFWNGFANLGAPWAPARWRLTLNNIVHIEGAITRPAPLAVEDANTVIFQLPQDCLPGGNLAFTAESGIGPGGMGPSISRIVVQSDGAVTWGGYVTVGEGAETFLTLAGVNFSVGGESLLAARARQVLA